MEEAKLSSIHIRHARAAAVFTDPRLRRILMWFAHRPKSVGEASVALGMDLKRTHYFVRRLEALRLLTVAGKRSRAGRPIKLYQAAGDAFFIPHEAAPRGFGDDLSRELRESLAKELMGTEGGMLFTAAEGGSARAQFVGEGRGPAGVAEMWRVLRLRPKEVAALKQDINALLDRYQRQAGKGRGTLFLVHAAVAPRLDADGIADNE